MRIERRWIVLGGTRYDDSTVQIKNGKRLLTMYLSKCGTRWCIDKIEVQ